MTTERTQRSLNDLQRGLDAHAADVLRLALHYVIRGGWAPRGQDAASFFTPGFGEIRGRISIENAIARARRELRAPWMRGVEAMQEVRAAIGAGRETVAAIDAWERDAARGVDDAKEALMRAIITLIERHRGLVLDVAV